MKEEPTHSKDCFIPEFPLDKLREWGRGGVRVKGGVGPVDASC